ncbi:hypothetical protein KBB48_02300 [Candidatus Shapirobacteria bacterium]|nr:hypothetical protein [Candidatus Shapirobacteria bacterium]
MWLLFFLFFVHPIHAQEQTDLYSQYRTDYLYQQSQYQKNYLDYLNKKDVYIQYRTISSEKDKIVATKNVLYSRNLMLKSYLMALRVGLDKYKSINPNDTEKSQIEIKKWEDWTDEQNLIIPNFNNTSDIQNWAKTFQSRYIEIQKVIYSGLTQANINLRLYNLNEIKLLADTIKSDQNNPDPTNDWFASYPVKSDLILKSFQNASTLRNQNQKGRFFSNFYPEVKVEINKADGYLKNLLTDLKSIAIKLNQ